ncbi:hypothetical protein [Butyrivibrio sp. MB2005]|uniref:hypothetical protein n=1 Tax=Butyrivibrio sp. MB2005 TaxID=1280678 RepID=UPI00041DDB34|nr:hypothetical protein [Butyrivibrio sp. MB2005]
MMYFVRIFLVVLIFIALYEFLELLYRNTQSFKNSQGGCQFFKKVPYDLDMVNIGSGPGRYGISYEYYDSHGFNFATAPQSYKTGFSLLKRFKNHIKKDAVVIIIVMSPLSFGRNNDHDRPGYMDKFYGILPKEDIDNYSLFRFWVTKHPLACLFFKKIKRLIFQEQKDIGKQDDTVPSVVNVWKSEFNLTDLYNSAQAIKHKEAFIEKTQILNDCIDFCEEMAWHPILVIPPIPSETREFISYDFVKVFVYDNIKPVLSKHKGLKVLNYYDDARFDNVCFMNDIFMNDFGREKFSKILFTDIRKEEGIV